MLKAHSKKENYISKKKKEMIIYGSGNLTTLNNFWEEDIEKFRGFCIASLRGYTPISIIRGTYINNAYSNATRQNIYTHIFFFSQF